MIPPAAQVRAESGVRCAITDPPRTAEQLVLVPHVPSLPPPWYQALKLTDGARFRRGSSAQGRRAKTQLSAGAAGGGAAVCMFGWGTNRKSLPHTPQSPMPESLHQGPMQDMPPSAMDEKACVVRPTQAPKRLQMYPSASAFFGMLRRTRRREMCNERIFGSRNPAVDRSLLSRMSQVGQVGHGEGFNNVEATQVPFFQESGRKRYVERTTHVDGTHVSWMSNALTKCAFGGGMRVGRTAHALAKTSNGLG